MNQDYPLFVKWYKTLDWIMDRTEGFPKSVRFSLSGKIMNLSLELLEGIIEAIYTKQRLHILETLNIRVEKLRILFRICHDRRYISIRQYEFISDELNETGRMLGGWVKREKGR